MVLVKIVYCEPCGWKPQAEQLAHILREAYGDRVSLFLEASGGGRFEVWVKERLVFSRLKVGRFPSPDEIKLEIQKELPEAQKQGEENG